jgi:hypothetical protein
MVVACIALAVTLSGVSYAAATLANNSVGTAQLKNNAVNSAKVANDSLTGTDINESTLAGVDAASLGGHSASDFEMAGGSDSYVVGGGTWISRTGVGRDNVQVTKGGATQWCTYPGATSGGLPAAYQDIHLPQGATLTEVSLDYRDDAASTASNGTATLTRLPLFDEGGTAGDVFSMTLSSVGIGEVLTVKDDTPGEANPTVAVIDNTRYAYSLTINTTTGLTGVAICSARIDYNLP